MFAFPWFKNWEGEMWKVPRRGHKFIHKFLFHRLEFPPHSSRSRTKLNSIAI